MHPQKIISMKKVKGSRYMLHLWLALTALTALVAAPAFAQNAGEKYTVFQGYALGTITLGGIQRDLGTAPLVKTGDAGESMASICYRTPSGLIYFLSGELGGPEHELLGFEFKKSVSPSDCAVWPRQLPVPKLVLSGLRLGMNKADFSIAMNTTLSWDKNIATATFESKQRMTKTESEKLTGRGQRAPSTGTQPDYFDVLVSIIGTFKHGRLVCLQVWKTETS
jgi:hypothetical protein